MNKKDYWVVDVWCHMVTKGLGTRTKGSLVSSGGGGYELKDAGLDSAA